MMEDYLRLIGLTLVLLGMMLVALLFLVQRMWKRIQGMSMVLMTMIPENEMKARLANLARQAGEVEKKRGNRHDGSGADEAV